MEDFDRIVEEYRLMTNPKNFQAMMKKSTRKSASSEITIGAPYVKPAILRNIMDINKFIFTRTAPAKKVETVENLSDAELLNIHLAAISKMVKEAGTRLYKSRDKELRISYERKTGNGWNSEAEGIRAYKGSLLVDIYLQYDNTDTSTSVSLNDFLRNGEYRGSVARDDRHGTPRSYYFTYTEADKAKFVKSLLLEYLSRKYKDRLN